MAVGPKQFVVVWVKRTLTNVVCLHTFLFIIAILSPLYLFHSTAVHPPYETCCLGLADGRQYRQNRTHARFVWGHSWLPAKIKNKNKENKWGDSKWTVVHCELTKVLETTTWATHPKNLLVAAGAGGSKVLLIATLAVHLATFLHKSMFCQGGVAVSTVEFLRVPWHAHGHKEWAPGKSKRFNN